MMVLRCITHLIKKSEPATPTLTPEKAANLPQQEHWDSHDSDPEIEVDE